jgi:hypothetical protein
MNPSPVIIIVPRKALSQNARGNPKYRAALAAAAQSVSSVPLAGGRLYSKVYYFHRGKRGIDADNLSKPVLDALSGIVYQDDSQVMLRIVAKIALDVDAYELIQSGIAPARYRRLIELIAEEPDILYVEVGELTMFRLSLGIV